jgi:flagellar biosynthesis protein FlhF
MNPPASTPNIRVFRAKSLHEAIARIRAEFGPTADIVRTREVPVPGILNRMFGRTEIEITAGPPKAASPTASPQEIPRVTEWNDGVGLDLSAGQVANSYASFSDPVSETPVSVAKPNTKAERETVAELDSATAASLLRLRNLFQETKAEQAPPAQPTPTIVAGPSRLVHWPETCFELYNELIEADLETDIARELITAVHQTANPRELAAIGLLRQRVLREMANGILTSGPVRIPAGQRRVVALIGPTGVGKTTTIAKLAANSRLRDRRRVGLLTLDTYRIAAVDQLRTYAEIIELPLAVASTPAEVTAALERMQDLELVLVDTAGRSPRNEQQLQEMRTMLAAIQPDETHLVMSCSSSSKQLLQTAELFATVGYSHLLLTKLDEALSLGSLVSLARTRQVPFSYLTTGQNVPDDIENAESMRLCEQILRFGTQRNMAA